MSSETLPNRYFHPPLESELADDAVRSHVRAEFFDVQSRFLDRLACTQVFDPELFVALLLWLDTLRRSCAASNLPLTDASFRQFESIAHCLQQEATYSRDQRAECAAAHTQWIEIMRQLGLPTTDGS